MVDPDLLVTVQAVFRCSAEGAQRIVAAGRLTTLSAPHTLARQGEAVAACWLIISGSVRLHALSADGRAIQLGALLPGDLCGGLAGSAELNFEMTAAANSQLLRFDGVALEEIAAREAPIALAIAQLYARQLNQLMNRLVSRTTLTAPGRVFAELIAQAGRTQRITPPPVVAALAVAAQTTRETASRAIGMLERRGIISRDGEALIIHSLRLLEDMAV